MSQWWLTSVTKIHKILYTSFCHCSDNWVGQLPQVHFFLNEGLVKTSAVNSISDEIYGFKKVCDNKPLDKVKIGCWSEICSYGSKFWLPLHHD